MTPIDLVIRIKMFHQDIYKITNCRSIQFHIKRDSV